MRALMLCAVAAASVVGTATADTARRPPRSVQQSMLQQILRGFPETRVTGNVGATSREWGRPSHTWIYFKIRSRNALEQVQQTWQTRVAAGLLAGISRSRGWRPVAGSTIKLVLPGGRERFESASVIGSLQGGIRHTTEAEAERHLRESAAKAAATLQTLRFSRPLGRLTVEVILTTDRPETFADRSFEKVWTILGSLRRRAEGFYVEIRTADGRWVAVLGTSVRTSSVVSTINPDFR